MVHGLAKALMTSRNQEYADVNATHTPPIHSIQVRAVDQNHRARSSCVKSLRSLRRSDGVKSSSGTSSSRSVASDISRRGLSASDIRATCAPLLLQFVPAIPV